MGIGDLVRRWRTGPAKGERVELKTLEQVLLAHLIRSGAASTAELQAEIDARHPILAQSTAEVTAALLSQGLAEARIDLARGRGGATFVATSKGLRLRKVLPQHPVTVTDFWV